MGFYLKKKEKKKEKPYFEGLETLKKKGYCTFPFFEFLRVAYPP